MKSLLFCKRFYLLLWSINEIMNKLFINKKYLYEKY